jgi:hypothetical protein
MTRRGEDEGRTERLAARLRDNLKRRKAQARSRRAGEADPRTGLDDKERPTVANPPESEDDVPSG